jgi:hypothetical protein
VEHVSPGEITCAEGGLCGKSRSRDTSDRPDLEQRTDEIILGKQAPFDQIVDDVTIDLGSQLSADEIFGLFDLARPT